MCRTQRACLVDRLMEHKSKNMKTLETAISQGLASVVDLQWPSRRWPIHVFTAGAMVCLATSTLCHLFGSMSYKRAQVAFSPLHSLHPSALKFA